MIKWVLIGALAVVVGFMLLLVVLAYYPRETQPIPAIEYTRQLKKELREAQKNYNRSKHV